MLPHHRVRLKVVSQLPPSRDHDIEHFLDVSISGLGFEQDFTDEIDRSLDQECMPSSCRSTTMAALTTWLVAVTYNKRGSLFEGGTRMGALESSALSLLRSSWASRVQEKCSYFLRRRYRGRPFSPRHEMKRLRDARHPMSFYTPFRF
jgi:hypothetical protein